MVTKKKFSAIIKRASQPLIISEKRKNPKYRDDYNGKQTRQHSTVNTSGKRSGKFR